MERRGVIVWCLDCEKFPPSVRCGVLSQLWWHCCVYFSYICQINRELVQNVTSCWHSNFEIWSYGIMFVDIFVLSSMNWKKVKELIHVTHVSILHQLFSELQFKNNILKYQYILLSVKIVLGKFLHVLLFIEHCDIYKSASIGNDKHFDL